MPLRALFLSLSPISLSGTSVFCGGNETRRGKSWRTRNGYQGLGTYWKQDAGKGKEEVCLFFFFAFLLQWKKECRRNKTDVTKRRASLLVSEDGRTLSSVPYQQHGLASALLSCQPLTRCQGVSRAGVLRATDGPVSAGREFPNSLILMNEHASTYVSVALRSPAPLSCLFYAP